MATHSSILAGKFHGRGAWQAIWGHKIIRHDLVTEQQHQSLTKQNLTALKRDIDSSAIADNLETSLQ